MASYHCSVKVGGPGKGASHSEYIEREGQYKDKDRYEDLEAKDHGNLPEWANNQPAEFWKAADHYERANGTVYREIEVALPRELTPDQRRELVEDFVQQHLGNRHAYQWAIHCPKAALEGREQPHAHILYSERIQDGIARSPEQHFKRYNRQAPERGGCRKDSAGTPEHLSVTRSCWAQIQNQHLERHGHVARVDHRSLADQGIERAPERHLGRAGIQRISSDDRAALLERRAAETAHDQAQRDLPASVDVSTDLTVAREANERREMAKDPFFKKWLKAEQEKERKEIGDEIKKEKQQADWRSQGEYINRQMETIQSWSMSDERAQEIERSYQYKTDDDLAKTLRASIEYGVEKYQFKQGNPVEIKERIKRAIEQKRDEAMKMDIRGIERFIERQVEGFGAFNRAAEKLSEHLLVNRYSWTTKANPFIDPAIRENLEYTATQIDRRRAEAVAQIEQIEKNIQRQIEARYEKREDVETVFRRNFPSAAKRADDWELSIRREQEAIQQAKETAERAAREAERAAREKEAREQREHALKLERDRQRELERQRERSRSRGMEL